MPQPEASVQRSDTPPPDPHSPTGSTNPPILPRRPLDGGGPTGNCPVHQEDRLDPPQDPPPGHRGRRIASSPWPGGLRDGSTGPGRRIRVLVVIKCLGYGGAERLLVDLMASRDAGSFDYEVAYVLAAKNALVPAVRAEGVPVHELGATHNWRPAVDAPVRHPPPPGPTSTSSTSTSPTRRRWAVWSWPRCRRDRRPVVVYTEHSLWEKTAPPVRVLNRLGIGRDQALVAVSPAAHDALPEALRPRAEVVVHGVHLSRSDEMLGARREVRAEVRAELGVGCDSSWCSPWPTCGSRRATTSCSTRPAWWPTAACRSTSPPSGGDPCVTNSTPASGPWGWRRASRSSGQRSDVLRLLAASDVFVLASRHEGLPVALMEATSMGLPIVATRVGGVPGVLTDELDALLVPPGQPDSLAQAIERLAGDPGLASATGPGGQGAQRHVRHHRHQPSDGGHLPRGGRRRPRG